MWRNVVPYVGIAVAVMVGTALAPYAVAVGAFALYGGAILYLLWCVVRAWRWLVRRVDGPQVIVEDLSSPRS